MKTVHLGDIHGRLWWKDIIAAEPDADLYIFHGDYVSTHGLISSEQQIENMKDILDFKESNPDKVILLRGNHDCQHLFNEDIFQCCAFDRKVARFMHEIKPRFMKDTQWVYRIGNILCSHAGVSTVWMQESGISDVDEINNITNHLLFGFTPDGVGSDFYGISPTQPPTWIRPQALIDVMPDGYIQIVGHTTLEKIMPNLFDEALRFDEEHCQRYAGKHLACIDNKLESYLVVEDNNFIVKTSPGYHVPN